MIDRREFMNKIVRWGSVAIIAGITLLLRRRIVTTRDCTTCPEYASCTDVDNCITELASR
jgi:hypothetical protein